VCLDDYEVNSESSSSPLGVCPAIVTIHAATYMYMYVYTTCIHTNNADQNERIYIVIVGPCRQASNPQTADHVLYNYASENMFI
jgi:hypothetical protein